MVSTTERIDRLEKVLFDIALHKNRCKYIYQNDLQKALIRRKVYDEKLIKKTAMNTKLEWHTPKKAMA